MAQFKNEQADLNHLARRLAIIDRKEFKFGSYDSITTTAQYSIKSSIEKIRPLIIKIQIGKAREILDIPDEINVLGPEQIQQTWGIELKPQEIPLMPFSYEDLKRAKELKQMLVLRVDRTNDGQPLSLKAMVDIVQPRWDREGRGKLLWTEYNYQIWKARTGDDWSLKPPRAGWALVSKELLSDSTDKNYAQQTEVIIAYLKDTVFKGKKIPPVYKAAFDEWEQVKQTDRNIQELLNNPGVPETTKKLSKPLSELKISQLTRQSIQEIIYDLALYFDKNNQRLLPDVNTWSNSLTVNTRDLMYLGDYLNGMGYNCGLFPGSHYVELGVLLSRHC